MGCANESGVLEFGSMSCLENFRVVQVRSATQGFSMGAGDLSPGLYAFAANLSHSSDLQEDFD